MNGMQVNGGGSILQNHLRFPPTGANSTRKSGSPPTYRTPNLCFASLKLGANAPEDGKGFHVNRAQCQINQSGCQRYTSRRWRTRLTRTTRIASAIS